MLERAARLGCVLRPHVKTAKTLQAATIQTLTLTLILTPTLTLTLTFINTRSKVVKGLLLIMLSAIFTSILVLVFNVQEST